MCAKWIVVITDCYMLDISSSELLLSMFKENHCFGTIEEDDEVNSFFEFQIKDISILGPGLGKDRAQINEREEEEQSGDCQKHCLLYVKPGR